jgi:hypothetical protein
VFTARKRRKWLRSFWISGVLDLMLSKDTANSTRLAIFSIKKPAAFLVAEGRSTDGVAEPASANKVPHT